MKLPEERDLVKHMPAANGKEYDNKDAYLQPTNFQPLNPVPSLLPAQLQSALPAQQQSANSSNLHPMYGT